MVAKGRALLLQSEIVKAINRCKGKLPLKDIEYIFGKKLLDDEAIKEELKKYGT